MLNYVVIRVSDLARSGAFYDTVLGPLGWRRQSESGDSISWGLVKGVFFVTSAGGPPAPGFGTVSFPTKSIPAVKAAWESGLEAGAESASQPGSPAAVGPGTYSARLVDPDGYTVEICVNNE